MRVLIVCAGGSAAGYTHRMCDVFSEAVGGADVVDVCSLDIGDCTGCS